MRLYNALGRPVAKANEMTSELHLVNGSRIIPLPGKEGTIRTYSGVNLLVADESARIPDSLYYAVRPMLAVSRGRLVALSTPFGKRGWFYETWIGEEKWKRVQLTADQCQRISKEFLAEEEIALGERWYAQEYFTEWVDTMDVVFRSEDIFATLNPEAKPLWG